MEIVERDPHCLLMPDVVISGVVVVEVAVELHAEEAEV
jgi:hypothetical protein